MIKLNLTTSCKEHELIKDYLEQHASETLANKINNGVRIEKDGIILINKKTLDDFMKYASDEARKITEKGKQYACVHHDIVFGWAVHYFEEDTIEGILYNEDGTEFKPKPIKKSTNTTPKVSVITRKPIEQQFTLFDLIENKEEKKTETLIEQDEKKIETINDTPEVKVEKTIIVNGNSIYQKYMDIQSKYPEYAVIFRLGDFYEVFGDNAIEISNKLDLTLTGRDCGLEERIPMVGFPYHVSNLYIEKILKFTSVVIVDGEETTVKEKISFQTIDEETGEVFNLSEEEMREFDGDIYEPSFEESYEDDNDDLIEVSKYIDKEIMIKLYDILGEEMTIA